MLLGVVLNAVHFKINWFHANAYKFIFTIFFV